MEHFQRFLKIFGPLIGLILLYFVVRYAVLQFQGDAAELSKVSPATLEEITQDPAILDALIEPMGEEAAGDEAQVAVTDGADAQAAADEKTAEAATEEMAADTEAATEELAAASVEEAAAERAQAAGDTEASATAEEASAEAVDQARTDAANAADAADEISKAETEAAASEEVAAAGSETAAVEADSEEIIAESDDVLVDAATGEAIDVPEAGGEEAAAEADAETANPLAVQDHFWLLQTINDSNGEAVELAANGDFSATFADGSLSGTTGCSNYAGKYQTDGASLVIAISATAPIADAPDECTDSATTDEEERYLAVLQSAAAFDVAAEQLTISDEDGAVVLVFALVASEEAVAEAETSAGDEAVAEDAVAEDAVAEDAVAEDAVAEDAVAAPGQDEAVADSAGDEDSGDDKADDPYAGLSAGLTAAMANGDAGRGEQLTLQNACVGCHNFDPAMQMVGPTWYNLAETAATRVEGQSVIEYIYTSIVNTNEYVVEGYQPNIMLQIYGDTLSEQDLADIITYLSAEREPIPGK